MKNKWVFSSPSGGVGREDEDKLIMSGNPFSFGVFRNETIRTGDWVRLNAVCRTQGLASPETAVTVMLSFYREDRTPVRRQYILPQPGDENGQLIFTRVFEIPGDTKYCVIELALRWPGAGSVTFDKPVLAACKPPEKRAARVAITYFNQFGNFKESWHDRIHSMVKKINACDPDLICFCEMLQGNDPEPLDGPFVKLLSQSAVKCNAYVIGNFLEADGDLRFNTSVLIDRKGQTAGIYHKTHLPLSEVESGTSPGDTYPVFETDFARIGMLTCWDTSFPDTMKILRENGAELVVNSTVGDFWPQDAVRARDNGLWFAVAGSHRLPSTPIPPSRIFDPSGSLVVATGGDTTDTFTYTDIDFNRCFFQHWISVGPCDGEPPSLYRIERRPETYMIN